MSLRKAAAALGIAPETFCRWANRYPDFRVRYLDACQVRKIWLNEKILEIAADTTGDIEKDARGTEKVNRENILRSKLRVDTLKWYLARMDPKRWGDKEQINVTNDGSQLTIEERERRVLELLELNERGPVIQLKPKATTVYDATVPMSLPRWKGKRSPLIKQAPPPSARRNRWRRTRRGGDQGSAEK